jgi:hypothetical protein
MCMLPQTPEMRLRRSSSMRSSSSSSSSSSEKHVSFGRVSVKRVGFRQSFDENEKAALWYSRSDIKVMNKRNCCIVRQEIPADETTESWRGLERKADQFRRWEMKMKIQQILRIQENEPSSTEIRCFAAELSRNDTRRSVLAAVQDATAANRIYKETMDAIMVDRCFL